MSQIKECVENAATPSKEATDGAWHWVRYDGFGGLTDWVPAQRQGNHWNSISFSGIPLSEILVGPAIIFPTPVALRYRFSGDLQWQYTERPEQATLPCEIQNLCVAP